MFDDVDRQLTHWVRATLGEVPVSLAAPLEPADGLGVSVYLLEVSKTPVARAPRSRPPLQMTLRYLVTTWAATAEESHQMLGALAFAALADPTYEVEADPVPVALWAGFGIPPRPSFAVRVRVQREWLAEPPPIVREPVMLRGSPVVTIAGVIVGPGDVPLVGARVECPAIDRSTWSNATGRFQLAGVPAEPPPRLLVTAKGQQQWVSPQRHTSTPEGPLVVRFDVLE